LLNYILMVDMELSVVKNFGRRRIWFYVSFSRSDFKEERWPQWQMWNYIPDSHFSDFEQERRPILLVEFHTKQTEILQMGVRVQCIASPWYGLYSDNDISLRHRTTTKNCSITPFRVSC
jgi:hypothetical protein